MDYIQFLKSGETTTTWEEQQKMDVVRKAYHRAVEIPMENVKKIWEDYQDFENGLNKITASGPEQPPATLQKLTHSYRRRSSCRTFRKATCKLALS